MTSKQNIDVLLINPGSRSAVYQELGDSISAIEPPSLAGLFATYLRNKGLSVSIIDAPAHNLSPRSVAQQVEESYSPTLIVMVVYGFPAVGLDPKHARRGRDLPRPQGSQSGIQDHDDRYASRRVAGTHPARGSH